MFGVVTHSFLPQQEESSNSSTPPRKAPWRYTDIKLYSMLKETMTSDREHKYCLNEQTHGGSRSG